MAHVAGLIDVLEQEAPAFMVADSGSVLVQIDDDTALRFRTLAHFDEWCEAIDRGRAAHGEFTDTRHLRPVS